MFLGKKTGSQTWKNLQEDQRSICSAASAESQQRVLGDREEKVHLEEEGGQGLP